jgi:hypothetical protein
VNRLKPILALVVLALWASCTLRCEIRSLTHFGTPSCCDEQAGESNQTPADSNQCVCSAIQAGGYVSPDTTVSVSPPTGVLVALDLSFNTEDFRARLDFGELIYSPPKLLTGWQFAYRAAGSARAPSFVS